MATTLGGFLIGVGLCIMLIIPIGWYNAWHYFYHNFTAEVESIGGRIIGITVAGFDWDYNHLQIPISIGLMLIISGTYYNYHVKSRGSSIKVEKRSTSITEALPTSPQSKYSSQYYCRDCGHLFWRDEYPQLKVSHCQKCGGSDLMQVAKLEYVETPPPETVYIRIVEQGKPPSSPLSKPSEQQGKYKSQFHCKTCGQSFWISEHRLKVPYCLNCGAPDPTHVTIVEQSNGC